MSKKLLASVFQNFKQIGNRLARPVSMVYNGETNGRRMILCPQEICCVDLTILRSAAWRSVCTYRNLLNFFCIQAKGGMLFGLNLKP